MSRTVPSFAEEGLKRFLHGMDRRIKDLERGGNWRFDDEFEPLGGEDGTTRNSASLLIVSATGDSIASGGDLVAFDSTAYNLRFAAITAGAQAITWPTTAVGEIQVEFAWDSYSSGGKIEIVVDGAVPDWGLIADGTSGQDGCKRRSCYIEAGAQVSIQVTQNSGSAQTADVLAEFAIPDPAPTPDSVGLPLEITSGIAQRDASAQYEVFLDDSYIVDWSGSGTIYLAGASDGTGTIGVDDQIVFTVRDSGGNVSEFSHDFTGGGSMTPAGPFDVTAQFAAGSNTVYVRLEDVWANKVSSTAIWLVEV